ncbi:MAG: polysulfide reductase NrfD [Planctomycetes bacterium]|nr:polysulfide reductase NrfD [Planctomycetota bacterium]
MPKFGFAIDNRVCIGCHACTVACKSEHDVPLGVNRTWVKYIEKGAFPDARRSFSVQRCNHCDDAPCVEICPVTSLYRRPDGIVDFDSDRCIGCTACMQACPYDAIYLDPNTLTAAKCNYCTHRVDAGYEPACVVVCPVEAIVSGDLDDPESRISLLDRMERVQYPKVEKGTKPKLFYVGGETAALDPSEAAPRTNYLWSGDDHGVTPAMLDAAENEAVEQARARRVYDAKRTPNTWGWKVSAYITTKAIAAGLVLVPFLLYLFSATDSVMPVSTAVMSMIFLAITGALLVADLKRPARFHYVLLRPQWKSWLVRGAYIITAFVPALLLTVAADFFGASRAAQLVVGGATAALAAGAAVYTAFLFAQAKGRDYWQSPLLPVTMLVDALVAGAAVLALWGTMQSAAIIERSWLGIGTASLALLVAAEFLPKHQTRNAARTASLILWGQYRNMFWLGAITIGLVLPGLLLMLDTAIPVAALLLLAGIAIRNHIVVQAPQQIPLS